METVISKNEAGIVTLNQIPTPTLAPEIKKEKKVRAKKVTGEFKSEGDVLKALKLDKKDPAKLTKTDHINIAAAARPLVKPLRKANPQLACALYYIHYKHTKLAKAMKDAKAEVSA